MNKALMISIRPEHAVNILNGKKTLELRTWIPKDYVGWVYGCISKNKPYISHICESRVGAYEVCYYETFDIPNFGDVDLNGKVAFRFWFDEYETIPYEVTLPRGYESFDGEWIDYSLYGYWTNATLLERSCLTDEEISIYGKGKDLYAWHIKKLEIFDTPKRLSEFYVTNKGLTYKYIKEYEEYTNDTISFRLKKAPQKMQWVYVKELENEPTSEI